MAVKVRAKLRRELPVVPIFGPNLQTTKEAGTKSMDGFNVIKAPQRP